MPMKQRPRLFLVVVLVFLVGGLLLVPSVRWPIYGWLRGEAFYQGMPTSWWAKEIEERYDYDFFYIDAIIPGHKLTSWFAETRSSPSLWERLEQRLKPGKAATPVMSAIRIGAPLLDGDAEALPVLLGLIRGKSSKSSKSRLAAISGLLAQGKQRPEVVEALLMATQDPDGGVREEAITVLKYLDRLDRETVRDGVK
jgi:hypothetical protein